MFREKWQWIAYKHCVQECVVLWVNAWWIAVHISLGCDCCNVRFGDPKSILMWTDCAPLVPCLHAAPALCKPGSGTEADNSQSQDVSFLVKAAGSTVNLLNSKDLFHYCIISLTNRLQGLWAVFEIGTPQFYVHLMFICT